MNEERIKEIFSDKEYYSDSSVIEYLRNSFRYDDVLENIILELEEEYLKKYNFPFIELQTNGILLEKKKEMYEILNEK